MSSTINATTVGVGGVVTTADNSGILVLQTASTTALTISAAQGVTLAGTLGVTGATTLSTTLGVTGATTLSTTLGVTGATTLSSTLGVTGATTLSSTLGVTGATTLTGTATLNSTLAVAGGSFDAITITGSSTNSKGMRFQNSAASSKNYNIGSSGGGPSPAGSFFIYDDTASATRMVIETGGRVLVNQTAAAGNDAQFQVSASDKNAGQFIVNNASYPIVASNNGSGSGLIYFNYNAGNVGTITTNGSVTAYNTLSDYRLKNTIAPMMGALDKVALLKPCTYKWNSSGSVGEGFIAHELQAVIPDAVHGEKDAVDDDGKPKYQGVDASFLVATLTAAIQELKAIIDTQAARITALETL